MATQTDIQPRNVCDNHADSGSPCCLLMRLRVKLLIFSDNKLGSR